MPSTLENLLTKTLPEGESIPVKDRSVLVFKALSRPLNISVSGSNPALAASAFRA